MTSTYRIAAASFSVFALILSASLHGASAPADPVATREALTALFSISNERIPSKSSCHGNYSQPGEVAVKHVIAMRLAYLADGSNTIEGNCKTGRCEVIIKHALGEDLASATIQFELRDGKAASTTLRCVFTP